MIATLAGSATVLTLDARRRRARRPRARRSRRTFATRSSQARRPRGDPLHVGHDRALEGRDADAPQSRVERRWRWSTAGASPAATRCCTRCRSITCTACSSRCTARCCRVHACCGCRSSRSARCALLPRATVMMGVPTFYTRLLAEPAFSARACRTVRLFVSGSAPLLPETFDAFRARTGHTILERYGMTETGMITSNPLAGARVGGTVGLPLPGVSVRVVDRQAAPCAPRCRRQRRSEGPERVRRILAHAGKDARGIHADGWFPHRRRRQLGRGGDGKATSSSSAARRT